MSTAPRNPFRALESYTRDDRDRFFGRDSDLTLILDRILSRRTTLLFAASGAGKTSFLNARVIPELEDRFFITFHSRWAGDAPLALVMSSLAAAWDACPYRPPDAPLPTPSVGEQSLLEFYCSISPAKPCAGCLIVLDQFEEVFQQHAGTLRLAAFVDALGALINAPTPDVRVLFSMREEFLGELSVFDNRVPDLFNNYYRLKNPNRRQARLIISNTVRAERVEPDAGLSGLIDDLTAAGGVFLSDSTEPQAWRDSVPLPFLQIACYGLWNTQYPGNGQTAAETASAPSTFPAAYQCGGALAQLRAYCTRILDRLTRPESDLLAEALGFLITRRGAKVAYDVAALAEHSGASESALRALLDRLSSREARLFRRTEAADGSIWYELYHDMYSPLLCSWKSNYTKERRARRRRRVFAGAAVLTSIALVVGGFYFLQSRRLEMRVAQLEERQLSTPLDKFALRFGRHTGRVMDVAFSSDGSSLATAGFDGTAKIWDPVSGLATRSITDTAGLHTVAFAPGPRAGVLALGGASTEVQLFDLRSNAVLRKWSFGKTVYALAFDPTGRSLACAGDSRRLLFYPLRGQGPRAVDWPNAINAAAFTPDGKELVVGDFGGRVAILGENSQSVIGTHPLSVLGVAVSPDGRLIASGSRDKTIRVFSRAGQPLFSLPGHTAAVRAVAFSPDSRVLASAGVDGTVRLWDLAKHTQIATLLGHVGAVYAVAFHPSGKTLVSSGQDSSTRLWDVAGRRQIAVLEGQWILPRTAQFSADLSMVVTEGSVGTSGAPSSSRNSAASLPELPGGHTRVWNGRGMVREFGSDVTAVGITRDGKTLALGKRDGRVQFLIQAAVRTSRQAAGGEEVSADIPVFDGPVRGLVFSGDGAVAGVQSDDALRMKVIGLDSSTPPAARQLATFHFDESEPAWFAALDEGGNYLAMAGRHQVAIYDRASGAVRRFRKDANILRISYNVFNELMVLTDDAVVESFSPTGSRRTLLRDAPRADARLAAAAEDGRSFALVTDDGVLSVWKAGVPAPLRLAVPRRLLAMAFSRDAARLGTLDREGVVRIFAVAESGSTGASW